MSFWRETLSGKGAKPETASAKDREASLQDAQEGQWRGQKVVRVANWKGIGRKGELEPEFRVRGGMNIARVREMYTLEEGPGNAARLEAEVLPAMRQNFRDLVKGQLNEFRRQLGTLQKDKSIRGKLAGDIAKVIDKIGVEKVLTASKPDPVKEMAVYRLYTWLVSNHYVPGDEKTYLSLEPIKGKPADEQRKIRSQQFATFDKEKMPQEVWLRSLDTLSEELDYAAKYALHIPHNRERSRRIAAFYDAEKAKKKPDAGKTEAEKKDRPALPEDLRKLKKMDDIIFPQRGLLGYLVAEFGASELSHENVMKRYGTGLNPKPLPALPVFSARKNRIVADADKQAKAKVPLLQRLLKPKSSMDLQLLRSTSIQLLRDLAPMTARIKERRSKLVAVKELLEKETEKMQPQIKKEAEIIARRINPILTAIDAYLGRIKPFEDPTATQARVARDAPTNLKADENLMQQKDAEELTRIQLNVNNLLSEDKNSLEKVINALLEDITARMPKELAEKISEVHIDPMSAKDIVGSIKGALGWMNEKEGARRVRDQAIADKKATRRVERVEQIPPNIKDILADLKKRDVIGQLQKKLQSLPELPKKWPKPPDEKLTQLFKQGQSLRNRIEHLGNIFANQENANWRKGIINAGKDYSPENLKKILGYTA